MLSLRLSITHREFHIQGCTRRSCSSVRKIPCNTGLRPDKAQLLVNSPVDRYGRWFAESTPYVLKEVSTWQGNEPGASNFDRHECRTVRIRLETKFRPLSVIGGGDCFSASSEDFRNRSNLKRRFSGMKCGSCPFLMVSSMSASMA